MLKTYMLPGEKLPGIYKDYLQNLPQAVRFLGEHYNESGVFAKKAQRVCAGYKTDRQRLFRMLWDYNRDLDCSEETEKQIEKLLDEQAVVVLCGQQTGLLSGPLYTIYKALGAVKLAARLEQELARPVVPVFWIAAEDHDFSEANNCYVLDKENKPQRIDLDLEHEGEPVGQMRLTAEAGQEVLEVLKARVPQTEFVPDILAWLEETRRESQTPADWFARIMAKLFAAEGLVLFNPLLEEARALAAPVFAQVVRRRQEVQAALSEREAALRAEGYPLQVEREDDASFLLLVEGRRTGLYKRGEYFSTRDGAVSYSEDDLLALIAERPEKLSPNVLLRPLVQDSIFPTVAFIPGPGETSYFAQVTAMYAVFGIEPPVLWPRPGVTVVEPRLARYLKKYDVPERELLRDLGDVLQRELKKKNDMDIDSVFEHLRSHLKLEYDHLKRELVKLNPQLEKLAEKNLQHVYSQVRYLEDKAEEEYKKKNEVMIRHFAALEQGLKPNGKLQERVFCVFTYLMKYGPGFWEQLVEEFPEQPGHHLFYPGK
ncbi:bacillithiol biosynthesis cysteine-adding enzyme BshC [Dethiobacter alkaliphilus]|uniref:Putative cysteine ligase BshC n=1 Tax=Dethiobacter alkaliphilus AHT 1 TaxID=555088 RepID=C0GG04_DETAL|nr:bacillithiol biosynthesis cysteine-adding enzyme BshC [Dethiobacter alkaliphilus]EEG77693.1 conserved hypothetical protein [Dethiobacter alkaliphilus AHT 1]